MKLNKAQVNALAASIHSQVYTKWQEGKAKFMQENLSTLDSEITKGINLLKRDPQLVSIDFKLCEGCVLNINSNTTLESGRQNWNVTNYLNNQYHKMFPQISIEQIQTEIVLETIKEDNTDKITKKLLDKHIVSPNGQVHLASHKLED